MRILWLCNVELPIISEYREKTPCPFGGWLDETSRFFSEHNEFTVLYPDKESYRGRFGNLSYYSFSSNDAYCVLSEILKEKEYDIYHIWGTEYRHSLQCVEILEKIGKLNRCIVNIQGLVSVIFNHCTDGLPYRVINHRTLKEIIYRGNIADDARLFREKGHLEIEVLSKVKNVIGRTEWDRACVNNINPNVRYFHCNENLRKCFYESKWDINNICRKTIFLSQCAYPLKGLHYLLEALALVKVQIPDVRIVTTGEDLFKYERKKWKLRTYSRYILELIKKYDLKNNIEFLGILDAEKMKNEYLKANIFVCPSTIENSSNSIGEAMILGCPVIASYVGGTPSLIDNNREGYLYQANSKEMLAYYIMKVLNNDEIALSFSKLSRERAIQIHDRDTNNKRLEDVYNNVINEVVSEAEVI